MPQTTADLCKGTLIFQNFPLNHAASTPICSQTCFSSFPCLQLNSQDILTSCIRKVGVFIFIIYDIRAE
jgi:hypothetical protein